jgi:hypothetical protein
MNYRMYLEAYYVIIAFIPNQLILNGNRSEKRSVLANLSKHTEIDYNVR